MLDFMNPKSPFDISTPIAMASGVIEAILPEVAAEYAHERFHMETEFPDDIRTTVCHSYITDSHDVAEAFMKAYDIEEKDRKEIFNALEQKPSHEGVTRFFTLVICRHFGGPDKITEKPKKSYIH